MTDTTKVIFSVIGTGLTVLTVVLVLNGQLREDMREIRGLLITHIASAHHLHGK